MAEAAARTPNDGFRQAMLKTALEMTPQLTDENYPIWKDKMEALLQLRGVLIKLNTPHLPLSNDENDELKLLLIAKMDSITHNNVVTPDNSNSAKRLWLAIKERFASTQASNRARIFNDFLYLTFKEDAVEAFITSVRVAIKKLVDVGIDLPKDVLAYLILFKFPQTLNNLKRQLMHTDKELTAEFVCDHLTQFNNEAKAETKDSSPTDAALFTGKQSRQNQSKKFNSQNKSNRCTDGFHNPKQDENHTSESCWHLHPDRAPDWWKDSQAKWKATKEKNQPTQTNYFMSLLTLWINHGDQASKLILDSGASAHIFNDKRFFSELVAQDSDVIKTGKADATLPIRGQGTVQLRWKNTTIELTECLYVPDIVINLVSAGALIKKGCSLISSDNRFQVTHKNQTVLEGTVNNNLFTINNPSGTGLESNALVSHLTPTLQEVHESYGHAAVSRLTPFIPEGIPTEEINSFECRGCAVAKITKAPFSGTSKLASKPFERIHLDLIGPIDPPSKQRHRYILTVVDNYSGYLAGFPIVSKDNTTDVLINLIENEKTRLGYYPTCVASDGGGEFVGRRAERANRTIVESMRAIFASSRLAKNYWHEVLKSACLMLNQIPRKGESKSPWEMMHGSVLPPNFLKPLGTPTIFLLQGPSKVKGRKFHEKGEEGRLIGFEPKLLSYRIVSSNGSIVKTKHTSKNPKNLQSPKSTKKPSQLRKNQKNL
ncbi:hypothetical protein VP01_2554g2 [Puccinia sorghi]|uniref:Integrase catalytic domain-containing protein n=1 Tax=Puccinia sorghi TaxID=27349 RepID=A0A0L6V702_9BASI|nr:hypothetical protein VP01_2554g2 [Puccinia sorghi]